MDAVKFVREQSRMCDSYKQCKGCPLVNEACVATYYGGDEVRIVEAVEQWSKKTSGGTK